MTRASVPITEIRLRIHYARRDPAVLRYVAEFLLESSSDPATRTDVVSNVDRILTSVGCLTARLPRTLGSLLKALSTDTVPTLWVDAARARLISRLRAEQRRPDTISRRAMDNLYFGAHAYGRSETSADLMAVTAENVMDAMADIVDAGPPELVLVGSQSPEEMMGAVSAALVPLPLSASCRVRTVEMVPRRGTVEIFNHDLQERAHIRMTVPGVERMHADYPALFLANLIFSGYSGSRLVRRMRDDRSMSYSPSSSWDHRRVHSSVGLFVDVSRVDGEAAVDELIRGLSDMVSVPPTDIETERARSYAIGIIHMSIGTQRGLSSLCSSLGAAHLDLHYLVDLCDRLLRVKPREIVETASRYLTCEAATILLTTG